MLDNPSDVGEVPQTDVDSSSAADPTVEIPAAKQASFEEAFELAGAGEEEQSETETDAGADATIPANDADEEETEPPGEEEKTREEDESDKTSEQEESDQKEDENEEEEEDNDTSDKTSQRSSKFKEVQAENEQLKNRQNELDKKFEKHGGTEVVETAVEFYDLATDPTKLGELDTYLQKLPHYGQLQLRAVENALGNEQIRVSSINRVLKESFGLSEDIPQDILEKTFEYVVDEIEGDRDGFISFLDRQLELANTPEKELARKNAEIERLKNSKQSSDKKDDTKGEESTEDLSARINKTADEFEDRVFDALSKQAGEEYGFISSTRDSEQVKSAKDFVNQAVQLKVINEMRQTKAQEPLIYYWLADNIKDNPAYDNAVRAYERAFKVRLNNAYKQFSKLFTDNTNTSPSVSSKKTDVADLLSKKQTSLPAKPQPKAQPRNKKSGQSIFESAWDDAG